MQRLRINAAHFRAMENVVVIYLVVILFSYIGNPPERRAHVAMAPTFGPRRRQGNATTADFVPFDWGPQRTV